MSKITLELFGVDYIIDYDYITSEIGDLENKAIDDECVINKVTHKNCKQCSGTNFTDTFFEIDKLFNEAIKQILDYERQRNDS